MLGAGLLVSCVAAFGIVGTSMAIWSPSLQTSENTVTVAKADTHQGSLYAAGNDIVIDGTVTGSVYCAANTVTVNGIVEGDVLCAGKKVTINGVVNGDVRAAGQTVTIGGKVGGSVTTFAQDARIDREGTVGGDLNGGAQDVTISGSVGRDVVLGGETLTIDGEVKGNVDVVLQKLAFGSGAMIGGNLNYGAEKELSFDTAAIKGTVSFNTVGNRAEEARSAAAGFAFTVVLMLAASAMVVALLAPRFLTRSTEVFAGQRLVTVLAGFAFVFGGPIVVLLLCLSVFLLPIGLALLFAWLVVLILSGIFFAYWIGSELLRSQQNVLVRMLGGIVIILVAYMIPVVGLAVMFAAAVVGSGMLLMTFMHGYRRPSYSIAPAKPSGAKK